VQGVGFRPFVHGLAARYELSGFVLNDHEGVLAEIEGEGSGQFLAALRRERPALARIDDITVTRLPALGQQGFAICASLAPSGSAATGAGLGVPDAATCSSCLHDLFDPASRFHLYPFVTCTACGPRFTITRIAPYDRANTSMAAFAPCGACGAEYGDPASRRFHAQAIACPACGPRLSHPVRAIAMALCQGRIVALKGVGGFHLLCDATNQDAVNRLRERKQRPSRPFAIMVGAEAELWPFARANRLERALLGRSARPIVLLRKGSGLAASIAPGLGRVGAMLPAAPVHHLLFAALSRARQAGRRKGLAGATLPCVVTSANIAGEPLIIDNDVALDSLARLADLIVTHDRSILRRADDSVMAIIGGAPALIRRGRGFAPDPIDLGEDGPEIVALGAHLKAAICVTRGREAFVSQHLGDLDTAETVRFYTRTLHGMIADLGVRPRLVACDLHPDYRTTRIAEGLGLPVLRVQHHAAHLAAVAAEHRLRGDLIGVALDGHGYGPGGAAWGGELMDRQAGQWHRLGHLRPLALPGGDRAAREAWRMGVAAMVAVGRGADAAQRFSHHPRAAQLAARLSATAGLALPAGMVTTSMGRLFDAAAALLGLCDAQSYEGQAAMELEALAGRPDILPGGFRLAQNILDFRPLLAALLQPGLGARQGARLFHGTLIAGLDAWIGHHAARTGRTDVVLGGGCFANRILAEGLVRALRRRGLNPWLPRALPANDGGIAFGQAAMARARLIAGQPTESDTLGARRDVPGHSHSC
jgi:hydrogenase maturation protein HypF